MIRDHQMSASKASERSYSHAAAQGLDHQSNMQPSRPDACEFTPELQHFPEGPQPPV